jgi:hypothetical protein
MYGGRQWRCPTCSADITIPRADEIPVEAVDEGARRPAPRYADDEPRGPAPAPRRLYEDQPYEPEYRPSGGGGRELAPSWGTARAGLAVVNIGLIIFLVAFVIFVLTWGLLIWTAARGGVGGRGADNLGAVAIAVFIVFILAALADLILWFVGVGMCCATPSGSAAKGLAVGSLICSVLFVVLLLAVVVFAIALGPRRIQGDDIVLKVIGWADNIVFLVAGVLFLFYLRAVASYFGNNGLAVNIIVFFIVTLLFVVGTTIANFLSPAIVQNLFARGANVQALATVALIVAIAILVVAILLLAWLTYLVGATRSSIPTPRPYGRRGDYY